LQEDQYATLIYLAQLSLEWEMFQTNFAKNIKAHILYSVAL